MIRINDGRVFKEGKGLSHHTIVICRDHPNEHVNVLYDTSIQVDDGAMLSENAKELAENCEFYRYACGECGDDPEELASCDQCDEFFSEHTELMVVGSRVFCSDECRIEAKQADKSRGLSNE